MASYYHGTQTDLLEAGFAASAERGGEGTAGGEAGVSEGRGVAALQPSEEHCVTAV